MAANAITSLLIRLSAIAGPALAVFIALATIANAAEIRSPTAVVELFTSQGCSSCPPADRALRAMVEEGRVLGLAFHVDYWDGLGWKDTFASPDNTERQWAYARALGERQVYTPQAVINGRTHLVGSSKQQILSKAEEFAAKGEGLSIPLSVAQDGDMLTLNVAGGAQDATLYAFYFRPRASVSIERGENRGRRLDYTNIVGKAEMIGMPDSGGMSHRFSLADMRRKGFGGCALILQTKSRSGHPGPILGAVVITGL